MSDELKEAAKRIIALVRQSELAGQRMGFLEPWAAYQQRTAEGIQQMNMDVTAEISAILTAEREGYGRVY